MGARRRESCGRAGDSQCGRWGETLTLGAFCWSQECRREVVMMDLLKNPVYTSWWSDQPRSEHTHFHPTLHFWRMRTRRGAPRPAPRIHQARRDLERTRCTQFPACDSGRSHRGRLPSCGPALACPMEL